METDKDHMHYMIETDVNINISNFIRTLKSYTTFHIWKKLQNYIIKIFLERKYILNRWIFYL